MEAIFSNMDARDDQGMNILETTWRGILERTEKEVSAKKLSVSVARCYPTKNRSPDVLPFDQTRVELLSVKVGLFLLHA